MTIAESYTSQIYDNLKYYATWLPIQPLQIGDYGTLNGKLFNRIGKIQEDFNIICNTSIFYSGKHSVLEYKSKGIKEICIDAEGKPIVGSLPINAEIKLQIEFDVENSIYFKISNLKYIILKNTNEISSKILQLFKSNNWKEKYVLITSVIQASSAVVLASEEKNAFIELSGNSSISESLDIFKVGAGVTVTKRNSIGVEVFMNKPLIPLFSISKIKPRSFLEKLIKKEPEFAFFITKSNITNEDHQEAFFRYLDLSNTSIEDIYEFGELSTQDIPETHVGLTKGNVR